MLRLLTVFICWTPESCCVESVCSKTPFYEIANQVAIAHMSDSIVWLQVVLGQALHQVDELLPSSSLPFDDIAAAVLLVFFGVRTLQVTFSTTTHLDRDGPLYSVTQP